MGGALKGCGPVQDNFTVTVIADVNYWIHLERDKWTTLAVDFGLCKLMVVQFEFYILVEI